MTSAGNVPDGPVDPPAAHHRVLGRDVGVVHDQGEADGAVRSARPRERGRLFLAVPEVEARLRVVLVVGAGVLDRHPTDSAEHRAGDLYRVRGELLLDDVAGILDLRLVVPRGARGRIGSAGCRGLGFGRAGRQRQNERRRAQERMSDGGSEVLRIHKVNLPWGGLWSKGSGIGCFCQRAVPSRAPHSALDRRPWRGVTARPIGGPVGGASSASACCRRTRP